MTMPLLVEHFDDLLATPEDVEQLNRAILQLTVQGKLVLQDSQDEPAEILYKRILKEKEQNLNERTPRPMPSVSQDEIPFDIPGNWVWTRLGEISNYGEATKSKTVEFTDETWVLDLEDIEKTTSRLIQRIRLKDRQFQSEKNVFQKGEVIYGKLRPYLDKVIVADEDGICSSELIPIKTYGNINPFYLRLALKRPDFIDYVNGKTYGVKMPRLGTQDARMALVPLPPLAEQKRIVARVEELFAQTRALAKELEHSQIELDGLNKSTLSHLLASETSEEFNQHWDFIAEHFDLLFQAPEHVSPLRQSILELAVRGKLTRREAGDESVIELLRQISEEKENLFGEDELRQDKALSSIKDSGKLLGLPEDWKSISINFASTHIVDCLHTTAKFDSTGYYCIDTTCIKPGKILFDRARKVSYETYQERIRRLKPQAGDILFAREGKFGTAVIVPENVELCLGQRMMMFRLAKGIIPEFYLYYLHSNLFKGQWKIIGTTSTHLNIGDIKKILLPLPPVAEQERIVKRVEQLLSLCDALEARLQSAEEERGMLVAAVMSTVGG